MQSIGIGKEANNTAEPSRSSAFNYLRPGGQRTAGTSFAIIFVVFLFFKEKSFVHRSRTFRRDYCSSENLKTVTISGVFHVVDLWICNEFMHLYSARLAHNFITYRFTVCWILDFPQGGIC